MKILGRDFSPQKVMEQIEIRLAQRGLLNPQESTVRYDGLEPKVDPVAFNLEALSEHADSTRALPLETHRAGLGRVVLLAKWAFRKSSQVLINEALGRQRLFNGHVRDSYAQLAAEVVRLREQVKALEAARK